jgi:23S rRNA (pseudouridine1915-N3)-methyltransferase
MEFRSDLPCSGDPVMRIKFLWVGKTRNPSVKSLTKDYLDRIRRWAACEVVETPDPGKKRSVKPAALVEIEGEELARRLNDAGRIVALDETGTQFSSNDFARWLESERISGTKAITFVIGGPEGLSRTVKDRAYRIVSLGMMTWPHELCRVLLLEQVYRAFCIIHNIPYHKVGAGVDGGGCRKTG